MKKGAERIHPRQTRRCSLRTEFENDIKGRMRSAVLEEFAKAGKTPCKVSVSRYVEEMFVIQMQSIAMEGGEDPNGTTPEVHYGAQSMMDAIRYDAHMVAEGRIDERLISDSALDHLADACQRARVDEVISLALAKLAQHDILVAGIGDIDALPDKMSVNIVRFAEAAVDRNYPDETIADHVAAVVANRYYRDRFGHDMPALYLYDALD